MAKGLALYLKEKSANHPFFEEQGPGRGQPHATLPPAGKSLSLRGCSAVALPSSRWRGL